LHTLESVGWLTPEDKSVLNALSLPRPLSEIDHQLLTPEMAAFFDLWMSTSDIPLVTGQIVQSQRWGRSESYRWRSHFQLPYNLQLDLVMDRSAEEEKIPTEARRTLTWQTRQGFLWWGDMQVRLGSGLFSAGSFPPRIGLESLSTFQRWNFSLRSHRSAVTEGRVSGLGIIGKTDFGRLIGTWNRQTGPTSVQFAWVAPEVRGNWGSAIRFVDGKRPGWESTVFGQIRGPKTSFTGEVTSDRGGHSGVFLAASLRREGIRVLVSGRHYAPQFHPINANPPRLRSSLVRGETGIFLGLRVTHYPVKTDLYMDASQSAAFGEKIALNQGLRFWKQTKRWRWRVEIEWQNKQTDPKPVFLPVPNPLYRDQRRDKVWITRTLIPGWTIGLQCNQTTVTLGKEHFRGWGIKGETAYRTLRSSWTLTGMITRISDPVARVYFWRLNLPYEMGSRSWAGNGYGLESRWMYRWETGARIGFRYGWIYQSYSGSSGLSTEGALVIELAL